MYANNKTKHTHADTYKQFHTETNTYTQSHRKGTQGYKLWLKYTLANKQTHTQSYTHIQPSSYTNIQKFTRKYTRVNVHSDIHYQLLMNNER